MDTAELKKYKDALLTNLQFHNDYDAASGLHRKVLIVEGFTDKRFIENIQSPDENVGALVPPRRLILSHPRRSILCH